MHFQRFVWQGEGPQSFTSKRVVYLHCWPLMMWIPSCALANSEAGMDATIHVKYGFAAAEPWNILATEPRSTLLNKMRKMTGSSPLATGLEYYQMPKNHVVLVLWFWCFWYLDHFTKLLDVSTIRIHCPASYYFIFLSDYPRSKTKYNSALESSRRQFPHSAQATFSPTWHVLHQEMDPMYLGWALLLNFGTSWFS